jgi:hypothetical protein
MRADKDDDPVDSGLVEFRKLMGNLTLAKEGIARCGRFDN